MGRAKPTTLERLAFAARVREAREARRWTPRDLADGMGWAPGYVSMVESARRANPSIEIVQRLATVLGVSFEWLATGKGRRAAKGAA